MSMEPSAALIILEKYGVRSPKTLTIAITGDCNLACSHCWVDAGVPSSSAHVPERTILRLVDEFAAMGGEGVRFTGGEPLRHPAWLKFMRHSRALDYRKVSLQTNGILIEDGHAAALRELDFPGLSIQISLDGASAETHDLIRGKGAFKGAIEGIQRLIRAGLAERITLFFTEMRHNLDEIPALLELAAEMGIASVVTGTLILGGRAAAGSLVAPPDLEQYSNLLQRYDSDPSFRELYEKIGNVAALEWRLTDAVREECCTFVENPYLTSGGRLYPCLLCHTDDYSVSGLFEKSLPDALAEGAPLWSSLLRKSRGRASAIPECRECPGTHACAGGCMGRAWGSCGNLLAADDRCELRRGIYRQQSLSR